MSPELDDPRRLRSDHHPTPFSAEEIRRGSPPGRTVRTLIIEPGVEPHVRVTRVAWIDDEGGEGDVWTETADGHRLSEPERWHSTWRELQAHASMPIAITTIDEETIEIPAGRFDCLRYTRVDGDAVDTFWFAKSRPGAPVRFEKRAGRELMLSSTLIDERAEQR